MEYRILSRQEIAHVEQLDRTECVDRIHYIRDGTLVLEEEHWDAHRAAPHHLLHYGWLFVPTVVRVSDEDLQTEFWIDEKLVNVQDFAFDAN